MRPSSETLPVRTVAGANSLIVERLENPEKVPLELIEVRIGCYLGEDEIIRTDDIYHRSPEETK